MQESVGTALYEFSNSSCVWGWLVSNLSLVHPAPACEGSQTLPVSVIATVMQVLNTFVLSMYQPAWDRRNKLNFKRTDMSAFYQVCLIIFCVKCNIRILAHWMQMCSSSGFCQECSALVIWKSQTFEGGYIIIPISEPAIQDYVVLMSKPVSYPFSERTCL